MLQIDITITTTGVCLEQQYMLRRGLNRFGFRENAASSKELKSYILGIALHHGI